MSVDGGPHDGDAREPGARDWPGADEAALELACTRIARHMVRSGARTVGVLPFAGKEPASRRGRSSPASTVDLGPLLERLASSIFALDGGAVALIGPWTSWGEPVPGGGAARSGTRH